mmetsp:Transcript_7516/g.9557  ORF Transcript_7516/g.9557 Transcript_7516/m.9557 type:complete len:80 (-) Transcript_7516:362-601(-)
MPCKTCGWRLLQNVWFRTSKLNAPLLLELWETQDVFKQICSHCLQGTGASTDVKTHFLLNPANQKSEEIICTRRRSNSW